MEDMEADGMDVDGSDSEVDQDRCRRAAQKLNKRLGAEPRAERQGPSMTYAQARDMLRNLGDLYTGNKITVDNAFDLLGIDALRTLIFSDNATASARCGEGHFQTAGAGLDISMKIYGKRVDAVYNLAYKSFPEESKQKASDNGDTGDGDQDQEDNGLASSGDGGEDGAAEPSGGKRKKRQVAVNAEATLVDDSELKHRVKEATFDTDPFFIRTSRLIDENSPQGLLLHNLPVLNGCDVVFDANVRPQEVLARGAAGAAPAGVAFDIMVDLTMLPGARELLEAASSASISPGIKELYDLLQAQPELPGLQVAAQVDPQRLLQSAMAENHRARVQAQRNAAVQQALRQVEDAMDVDMADDAGAAGDDGGGVDAGNDDGAAFSLDGDAGAADDGYGSPGYGGQAGTEDEDPHSLAGTGGGGGGSYDDHRQFSGHQSEGEDGFADKDGSDDESALLGLLVGAASSQPGSSATLQRTWWKSHARKTVAAAGAKPRTRKPKPEQVPLDWRGAAPEAQLEDVALHTYKIARRDATAKLCSLQEEPGRVEDLCAYFSSDPARVGSSWAAGGCGSLIAHSLGGGAGCGTNVHDTWRAVLIADNFRERQLRRGARAAAPGTATPGLGRSGVGGPAMSSAEGQSAGVGDTAEEYGSGDYGGDQDDYDDSGAPDGGAGSGSDDDGPDDGGGDLLPGPGRGGGAPTLEELLQPPRRRIQRLAVKFDKTAGVADVATLKTNMENSLKHLAVDPGHRRKSTPTSQPVLPFQSVLNQVAANVKTARAAARGAAPSAAGAGGRGDPLAGVSTHLAFICLLHLTNEKDLALGNGGNMDTLLVTGLGNLAAAR